jgi:hypothetical protein
VPLSERGGFVYVTAQERALTPEIPKEAIKRAAGSGSSRSARRARKLER